MSLRARHGNPVELSLRDLSQLVVLQAQRGTSRDEIVKILVERGWPGVSAVRFVDMTLLEESGRSEPAQAQAMNDQQPPKENYTKGMVTWQMLLVVILLMVIATVFVFLAFG